MKIYSLTLCLFLSIHLLGQHTITVNNTNDAGEGSLREAISISVEGDHIVFDTSLGGDTVFLDSAISIFNSVSIHGRNAIVSAKNANRIFFADGLNSISIDSLTLTDAFAEEYGGAIQFTNMGDIRFSNVVVKNNLVNGECAAYGGGVYISDSEFFGLYNSMINDNEATLENGGGCVSAYGGGVHLDDVQNVEVVNSLFQDNQIRNLSDAYINSSATGAKGGGLYIKGGSGLVQIENTEFNGNLCYVSEEPYKWGRADGGGLFLRNYGKAIVQNSQFLYNTCESHKMGAYAGGANLYSRSLELSNNLFEGNFVITASFSYNNTSAAGGGAIVDGITDCWVHHNTFKSNVVIGRDAGSGGGLNAYAGRIEDNIIETNTVQSYALASGGGLGVSSSNESFVVKNNIIRQNSCYQREGGNPDAFLAQGVGMYASSIDLMFFGNQIYSNQFTGGNSGLGALGRVRGVGMYCRSHSNSKAVLRNNLIFQNLAFLDANREEHYAGLYLDANYVADVEIRNNSFYFNQTIIEEDARGVNVYCKVSRESKLKLVGNIIEDTFPESVKDIELIFDDSEFESGYNVISSNLGAEQFFGVGTPNSDNNYVGDTNNRFYSMSSAIRDNQTNEMNLFVAGNSPIIDNGDPNDFSSDYREFSIVGTRDIGAYEYAAIGEADLNVKGNSQEIEEKTIPQFVNTGQVQFLAQDDSVEQVYWLYNNGIGNLHIDSIVGTAGIHNSVASMTSMACDVIMPGDSCLMVMEYKTNEEFFGDTLHIIIHTSFLEPFEFPVILSLKDTLLPNVLAKDTVIFLNDDGEVFLPTRDLDNGSSDNSNWILFDTDTVWYSCENVGSHQQVFEVTDFVGNSNSVTVEVTVLDSVKPKISSGIFPIYLDKDGVVNIDRSMWEPYISDNCWVDSVSFEKSYFTMDDLGLSFVSTTAWDNSMNSSTELMKIFVVDSLVKVKCKDRTISLVDGFAEIDSLYFDNGTVSNGYEINSIKLSQSTFNCFDLGKHDILVTVTLQNGFQYDCNTTLTVLPAVVSLPESCMEYDDGAIYVPCAQNTNASYSLDGVNFQTNSFFNNLNSGDYELFMRVNGQTFLVSSISVESASPVSVELLPQAVTCYGENNGSLIIVGESMHSPISYSLNGSNFDTITSYGNLYPQNYSLIIKDANGCTYDTSFFISEPTELDLSLTVTPERVGGDGNIEITATGGTFPYRFGYWDFQWDSLILGNSNLGQNLTSGNYTIGVLDANNCLDSVSVFLGSEIGLNEEISLSYTIYPNPSAGMIYVDFNRPELVHRIELINTIGEVVMDMEQIDQSISLDFTMKAKGPYYLKMYSDKGVSVETLILR